MVVEELIWSFCLAFGRTRPVGCCGMDSDRTLHAGAGGGCGRSSAIRRSISWNICRGIAIRSPTYAGPAGFFNAAPHAAQRPVPLRYGSTELGVGERREIAERAVWPDGVVVVFPHRQGLARMAE